MNTIIKCPNCGTDISKALIEQIRKESTSEIEKSVREKIADETKLELEDLQKALKEKNEKIETFTKAELGLREEKRKLEDEKRELKLEVQRQIDEQRKTIEENVLKQAAEEHRLKDAEKDKTIADLKKLAEDLKRKAQQGSMQTQGEVLELDLEEALRTNFRDDDIQSIEKGVLGADVRQIVKSPNRTACGIILWESKRTKLWSDSWVEKLKNDMRNDKADVPALVSEVMPRELPGGMGQKNGVWITTPALTIPLAMLLRKALLDAMRQKVISQNKQTTAEELYSFVTGQEFSQTVGAMVEIYLEMKNQITRERVLYEKQWKQREAQVSRLLSGVAGIYGNMQEIAGSALPPVKNLELESGLE